MPTCCQHRRLGVRAHRDWSKTRYQLLLRMHSCTAFAAVVGPASPAAAMPSCGRGSTCAAAAHSRSSWWLSTPRGCCYGSCCCLGFCLQSQEALPQLLQLLGHRDVQRSLRCGRHIHARCGKTQGRQHTGESQAACRTACIYCTCLQHKLHTAQSHQYLPCITVFHGKQAIKTMKLCPWVSAAQHVT
jgi:hypothetical protein